jgi:hypothetical protein
MRLVKLHCEYDFHADLELHGQLTRAQARLVIVQQPCRSCSRFRSSDTVKRRVYHRWDGNGVRLKDRTLIVSQPEGQVS